MIHMLALSSYLSVAPVPRPYRLCYDQAAVVHIEKAENSVDLKNLLAGSGLSYVGARWDVDLSVTDTLEGDRLPPNVEARIILTDMYSRETPLFVLIKKQTVFYNENAVTFLHERLIPAATPAYPWQVIFVERWRQGADHSDLNLPPRC